MVDVAGEDAAQLRVRLSDRKRKCNVIHTRDSHEYNSELLPYTNFEYDSLSDHILDSGISDNLHAHFASEKRQETTTRSE